MNSWFDPNIAITAQPRPWNTVTTTSDHYSELVRRYFDIGTDNKPALDEDAIRVIVRNEITKVIDRLADLVMTASKEDAIKEFMEELTGSTA